MFLVIDMMRGYWVDKMIFIIFLMEYFLVINVVDEIIVLLRIGI